MGHEEVYEHWQERVAIRQHDGRQSEYRAAYAAAREIRAIYGELPPSVLGDLERISEEYRRSLSDGGRLDQDADMSV